MYLMKTNNYQSDIPPNLLYCNNEKHIFRFSIARLTKRTMCMKMSHHISLDSGLRIKYTMSYIEYLKLLSILKNLAYYTLLFFAKKAKQNYSSVENNINFALYSHITFQVKQYPFLLFKAYKVLHASLAY